MRRRKQRESTSSSGVAVENDSFQGKIDMHGANFSLRSPDLQLENARDNFRWLKILYMVVVVLFLMWIVYAQRFSIAWAGSFPLIHAYIPFGINLREVSDLAGKIYVVTGANSGLGNSTAALLAALNATVVMACRDIERCKSVAHSIRSGIPRPVHLFVEELDLSDLVSVSDFGKRVERKFTHIDGLVLNAGVLSPTFALSRQGIEQTFAINHVGHFALFHSLLPLLEAKGSAAVVSVTAAAHENAWRDGGAPTSLKQVNDAEQFDSVATYGMTKLANILFIKEVDRRYHSKGITATAVNPGLMRTNFYTRLFQDGKTIQSSEEWKYRALYLTQDYLFWKPRIAALTILGALTTPLGHGEYTVAIHRTMQPSNQALNETTAKNLWDFTHHIIDANT